MPRWSLISSSLPLRAPKSKVTKRTAFSLHHDQKAQFRRSNCKTRQAPLGLIIRTLAHKIVVNPSVEFARKNLNEINKLWYHLRTDLTKWNSVVRMPSCLSVKARNLPLEPHPRSSLNNVTLVCFLNLQKIHFNQSYQNNNHYLIITH